jgi:hypothetical protein
VCPLGEDEPITVLPARVRGVHLQDGTEQGRQDVGDGEVAADVACTSAEDHADDVPPGLTGAALQEGISLWGLEGRDLVAELSPQLRLADVVVQHG